MALLHRAEPRHTAAVAAYGDARIRITHSYVLAELLPLAKVRGYRRDLVLDFSKRMLVDSKIAIFWVDESLQYQALDLLMARPDKSYSLCDAVSFVLMRHHGILGALTTDRHFEQEGFQRLLS